MSVYKYDTEEKEQVEERVTKEAFELPSQKMTRLMLELQSLEKEIKVLEKDEMPISKNLQNENDSEMLLSQVSFM